MRVAIFGYGNLGRASEIMSMDAPDTELVGVFTRRAPEKVKTVFAEVYHESMLGKFKDKIDCILVCTGSAVDLPAHTPRLAEMFTVVDSYDNHKLISAHKAKVGRAAEQGGNTAIVSVGWDPGLLSLVRLYTSSFMPYAVQNTFWGPGVSQGHSEALRSLDGVKKAIQYTVPIDEALMLSRMSRARLTNAEKHKRVCYIVAEKEKEEQLTSQIRSIPEYFSGYETEISFLSDEEFECHRYAKNHKGRIIAHGETGLYHENTHSLEFEVTLASNPEFTAGIMLSAARAAVKMKKEGHLGAYTLFDIPPSYFIDSERYSELL